MTWIETISPDAASGRLAKTYAAAIVRAGHVAGIVRAMSLAPPILDASMGLYKRIMFAEQGLERHQRELLATVVSHANDCHY